MSQMSGKAIKYNGEPIDYVLLFDWLSGKCLGKSIPDLEGNWSFNYNTDLNCGITYVADGCEPITHGSYFFAGTWALQPLLDNNEIKIWLDPSDLATMFQNTSGTVPVTSDGQPVGLIMDKSGNEYHATQPLSASRPIYRTDGDLHWLDFNGTTQFLVIENSAWFNSLNNLTWVLGVNISTESENSSALVSKLNPSGYNGFAMQVLDAVNGRARIFGMANGLDTRLTVDMGTNIVLTSSYSDGGRPDLSVDKQPPAVNGSKLLSEWLDAGSNRLSIGVLNYYDLFAKFRLYGLVMTNTNLTDYRIPAIDYLAEQSGIVI